MHEVELVEDDLGHYADASPNITQGLAEILSANRTIDHWASRVFFLLWRLVEYSSATFVRKLNNLYCGQRSLVVDDVLNVAGVSWYMYHIQQWDVDMYLLDHLNKTSELLVHGDLLFSGGKREDVCIESTPWIFFLEFFRVILFCRFFLLCLWPCCFLVAPGL